MGSRLLRTGAAICGVAIVLLGLPVSAGALTVDLGWLTGRAVSTTGVSEAGARVLVYAQPDDTVLSRLTAGQAVPESLMGTAISSADGSFSLSVPSVTVPTADVSTAGGTSYVNYDVAILGADGSVGGYSFTAGSGGAAPTALPAVTLRPHPGATAARRSPMATDYPADSCASWLVKSKGTRDTVVGGTWSNVGKVRERFSYRVGASSKLGVAISSDGSAGSWSANGTTTHSSTSTLSYPAQHMQERVRYHTGYVYGKYGHTCYSGGPTPYTYYSMQATKYAGGSSMTRHAYEPAATHCVTFSGAGTTWTKSTDTAYEFSNGVSISGVIGFNLSATTGYSHDASVAFTFNRTRTRVCGSRDVPGGNAGALVAKAPST